MYENNDTQVWHSWQVEAVVVMCNNWHFVSLSWDLLCYTKTSSQRLKEYKCWQLDNSTSSVWRWKVGPPHTHRYLIRRESRQEYVHLNTLLVQNFPRVANNRPPLPASFWKERKMVDLWDWKLQMFPNIFAHWSLKSSRGEGAKFVVNFSCVTGMLVGANLGRAHRSRRGRRALSSSHHGDQQPGLADRRPGLWPSALAHQPRVYPRGPPRLSSPLRS